MRQKAQNAAIDFYTKKLTPFMPGAELATILDNALYGDEKDYFWKILETYTEQIRRMPATYETDGMRDRAPVTLHYFSRSADWYIIEKDAGDPGKTDEHLKDVQAQAFGLATINGQEPELGYISIDELITAGVELDLHFEPCTLGEIREKLTIKGN